MISHIVTPKQVDIKEFIADIFPFNYLSEKALDTVVSKIQFSRYRMGQAIMRREAIPEQISIIYEGQARLLGFDSRIDESVTLKLLSVGETLGWISHIRGVACETIIASTEVVCLNLPIATFTHLLKQEITFAQALYNCAGLVEIYELLAKELHRRADGETELARLTHACFDKAVILSSHTKQLSFNDLKPDCLWLVSNSSHPEFPIASSVESQDVKFHISTNANLRLLGLPKSVLQTLPNPTTKHTAIKTIDIPYAPEIIPQPELNQQQPRKFPYIAAKNPQDAAIACFQMLSQYFNIPLRRDMLRQVTAKQMAHTGSLSLQFCGAIAELLGLTTQMVKVPVAAIPRLQMPVMVSWQDSFAIIYQNHHQQLLIAVPEIGLIRRKIKDFAEVWGSDGEVLLLQPNKHTPKSRFGLRWFVPEQHFQENSNSSDRHLQPN